MIKAINMQSELYVDRISIKSKGLRSNMFTSTHFLMGKAIFYNDSRVHPLIRSYGECSGTLMITGGLMAGSSLEFEFFMTGIFLLNDFSSLSYCRQ